MNIIKANTKFKYGGPTSNGIVTHDKTYISLHDVTFNDNKRATSYISFICDDGIKRCCDFSTCIFETKKYNLPEWW